MFCDGASDLSGVIVQLKLSTINGAAHLLLRSFSVPQTASAHLRFTLPTEIWQLIFEFVAFGTTAPSNVIAWPFLADASGHVRPSQLFRPGHLWHVSVADLSCVCRLFNSIAQKIMFTGVLAVVKSGRSAAQWTSLFNRSKFHQNPLKYVKHIELQYRSRRKSANYLALYKPLLNILKTCSQLSALTLTNSCSLPQELFEEMMRICGPTLRRLRLDDIIVSQGDPYDIINKNAPLLEWLTVY